MVLCISGGDIESDELIKPETIDRHTVDENVNFIAEEYDKAIAELPAEISDFTKWAGRITKGSGNGCQSALNALCRQSIV